MYIAQYIGQVAKIGIMSKKESFKKQQKTKRINIYLTTEEKLSLEKTKEKYKVSFSTIADKTAMILARLLLQHYPDEYKKIVNTYWKESIAIPNNRTNIKPKWYLGSQTELNQTPIILFTNLMHYYTTKFKDLNINQADKTKCITKINNELSKARETYWNLNNIIRTQKRANKILGAK